MAAFMRLHTLGKELSTAQRNLEMGTLRSHQRGLTEKGETNKNGMNILLIKSITQIAVPAIGLAAAPFFGVAYEPTLKGLDWVTSATNNFADSQSTRNQHQEDCIKRETERRGDASAKHAQEAQRLTELFAQATREMAQSLRRS